MMRIAVWAHDLSDSYLRKVTQLGVDCIDGIDVPNVPGEAYPDLDELLKIKKKVQSWGLRMNRVSVSLGPRFMQDQEGGEQELEAACKAVQVYGEAGVPLVRLSFANDTYPWMNKRFDAVHRGGYRFRGESVGLAEDKSGPPSLEAQESWWDHLCQAYETLVPIAEQYDARLMMHPSDTPNPDAPLGGLNYHRIIDAFPGLGAGTSTAAAPAPRPAAAP